MGANLNKHHFIYQWLKYSYLLVKKFSLFRQDKVHNNKQDKVYNSVHFESVGVVDGERKNLIPIGFNETERVNFMKTMVIFATIILTYRKIFVNSLLAISIIFPKIVYFLRTAHFTKIWFRF